MLYPVNWAGQPDCLNVPIHNHFLQELQELQELERVYFTFLQGITNNGLSTIMLSFKNSHLLNDIIQSILVAACQHKDVLVRKVKIL